MAQRAHTSPDDEPNPARGFLGRLKAAAAGRSDADLTPEELVDEPQLAQALREYSETSGVAYDIVRQEARGHLREMMASHSERATRTWNKLGAWLMRAHDIVVDEDQLERLRKLDREHAFGIVFSHRSYLDGWVLPHVMESYGLSPTYTFGGANLDLPVVGQLVSRTGIIFIRRNTKDIPVYRIVLRAYISYLVARKSDVAWSIEGGRTRTGKLRPPVHGILRYLTDAAEASTGPDVMLVPVAIVYDQLHEVAPMTAEAKGGIKTPEDLGWLVRFARSQTGRMGRAYVSFGDPIPLRARMTELRAEGQDTVKAVERIAIQASHRINRATPVTVTAVVCYALLGADRALTFDRVLDTVAPLADYIAKRQWPVAGKASLHDPATIRKALNELTKSGVLQVYEEGTEPIWGIADGQHLVAAFYRNTIIHMLIDRAIGEVALQAAAHPEPGQDAEEVAWQTSLALRDLLKFEFFFPRRADFTDELSKELELVVGQPVPKLTSEIAEQALLQMDLRFAPLTLRPFIDAYHLVADRLAAAGEATVNPDEIMKDALRVGQQWELERRIASAESVSLELFKTAIMLAQHRHLIEADVVEPSEAGSLSDRRQAFLREVESISRELEAIEQLSR